MLDLFFCVLSASSAMLQTCTTHTYKKLSFIQDVNWVYREAGASLRNRIISTSSTAAAKVYRACLNLFECISFQKRERVIYLLWARTTSKLTERIVLLPYSNEERDLYLCWLGTNMDGSYTPSYANSCRKTLPKEKKSWPSSYPASGLIISSSRTKLFWRVIYESNLFRKILIIRSVLCWKKLALIDNEKKKESFNGSHTDITPWSCAYSRRCCMYVPQFAFCALHTPFFPFYLSRPDGRSIRLRWLTRAAPSVG